MGCFGTEVPVFLFPVADGRIQKLNQREVAAGNAYGRVPGLSDVALLALSMTPLTVAGVHSDVAWVY